MILNVYECNTIINGLNNNIETPFSSHVLLPPPPRIISYAEFRPVAMGVGARWHVPPFFRKGGYAPTGAEL